MKPLALGPILRSSLLTVATCLAGAAATAGTTAPQLPFWQVLDFEQKAFMVTAHSRVEIMPQEPAPDSADEPLWRLSAFSSVAKNSEEVELVFAPTNGQALSRSRLGRGQSDQRLKSYQFLPDHLIRERRDPAPKTSLPADQWPLSSRREVPYPKELPAGSAITDAYALLPLAERFQSSNEDSTEVVVSTDTNFYRVRMTHSDGATIKVDYRETASKNSITGKRATRGVNLDISPLGVKDGKPDFSLLGLYGKITLLFDQENGLLLQLRGTAPRVGEAKINLKSVTLRDAK